MNTSPLDGVTVLDLSTEVAGPYCTRLLAGLGARVVKVEPPDGDPARVLGPFVAGSPSGEGSTLFHHLNAGKQSVVIDVASSSGMQMLRELASRSQIVVESFPPGTMSALGLGFDDLRSLNPALVMTSISHFGQSGPYGDFRGADLVDLALGGLLYTSGEPDREPVSLPGYQAGYAAGLNAALATLGALLEAEASGTGQHVDVSAMESVVSMLDPASIPDSPGAGTRRRQGNRHGRSHPMTILPCKDGYVGVMVPTDADWEMFKLLAGVEALHDPRYATVAGRLAHADEIDAILKLWLMAHTREDLFHAAQELRLPLAMILSPAEVLSDPQLRERGFFSDVQYPMVGRVLQVGPPFRMSESPWRSGRAPLLGEHDAEAAPKSPGIDALAEGPRPGGRAAGSDEARRLGRSLALQDCYPVRPSQGTMPQVSMLDKVLRGARVVDLTTMWAGPFCTRLLADMGAEVIKIESPRRIDGTRANPARFTWLNRGKRSLSLDLNTEDGGEVFRDLVRVSDVVVESFSPRVMPNFGLDYSALREVRPDLIMLSMPAYGSTGPYRHFVAYGPSIEAMAGMSWLGGYQDGPPLLSGSAWADPVAGLHGALAVLAALRQRCVTGRGQWIDLSQWESLMQFLGEFLVLAGDGRERGPHGGNEQRNMAPYGCYRCAGEDRWVAIAVADDAEWRNLCGAMGMDSLAEDARFATVEAREEREGELRRIIEAWTGRRDPVQAMQVLQAAGVPAGAVLEGEGLLRDEHLATRGFLVEARDPDGEAHHSPGLAWRTLGAEQAGYNPAPRLGQNNHEILSKVLGLDDRAISLLETNGVVGAPDDGAPCPF